MTDAPLAQTYRLNLAKRVWEIGGSSLEPPPTPASSRTRIRFAAGEPKADVGAGYKPKPAQIVLFVPTCITEQMLTHPLNLGKVLKWGSKFFQITFRQQRALSNKSYLGFLTAAGVVIAVAANLSTIIDFATTKLGPSCRAWGVEWCATASAKLPFIEPNKRENKSGQLAVNIEPQYAADARMAEVLTTYLASQLGELSSEADGYNIDAIVSKTQLSSSGSTAFEFSWNLSFGKVIRSCKPIPIRFRSDMTMLAASRVAARVKPFLERSIQFEDVRC